MFFPIIIYYILYISFIFGLVPSGALFYIRPLFILILTIAFTTPILIINKTLKSRSKTVALSIFIIILNTIFFIILGEFGRIELLTSIKLAIITDLIGIFILLKFKVTKIIGILLGIIFISIGLWNGKTFKYQSNLNNLTTKNNTSNFTYGINGEIKTYSVDSSPYYKGTKGLASWYDKQYWNITTELPLNGKVFYPNTPGKYPLVVIVHGNHLAEDLSHNGYDYILQNLANHGFIATSIDENFLNGNWTTLGKGNPRENDARGLLILEHIELYNKWNKDNNSKLYSMIDMENIGLIGHSRGGEAISIAAFKNKKFKIKSLMAIAPTDRQYKEYINLENVSYITLSGANDGDLESFKGRYQYNRVKFTNSDYNFKASYYIEGANHAMFNSDWGLIDSSSLGKLFYGKNRNIKPEDQREISKKLSEIFFNITLKDKKELLPYIKDLSLVNTLPNIQYITDYSTSNFIDLYTFSNGLYSEIESEDLDIKFINHFADKALKASGTGSISLKNISETTMGKLYVSMASEKTINQEIILNLYKKNQLLFTKQLILKPQLNRNILKTETFLKKIKQKSISNTLK